MRIRRATPEDGDAVAETIISAWRWAYRGVLDDEFIERRQVGPTAQRIRENWNPDRLALVLEDETGLVVAQTSDHQPPQLAGYDAEIGALYVRAGYDRRGYGRAVLRAAVEILLAQGYRSLCIHTLRENPISRRFYEGLGGTLVGEDEWRGYPAVWYGWPDMATILTV